MTKWQVHKVVKQNGKAPFDKWYGGLTVEDQANVDDALYLIESVTQIPPDKVKKYNDLYEIKIYGNKTALRPLALKVGKDKLIVLLVGETKKGKIPISTYKAALKLAKFYNEGDLDDKHWQED